MGLRSWIATRLGRRQREWSFTTSETAIEKAVQRSAASPTPPPRITMPDIRPRPSPAEQPGLPAASVILGFEDGTELKYQREHPMTKDFQKIADRMMKRGLRERIVSRL